MSDSTSIEEMAGYYFDVNHAPMHEAAFAPPFMIRRMRDEYIEHILAFTPSGQEWLVRWYNQQHLETA